MTVEQQLAKALERIRNAEALMDYPRREALIACAMALAEQLGYSIGIYRGEAEPARATYTIDLPSGRVQWRIPPGGHFETLADAVQSRRVGEFYNAHVLGGV